jgi:membrane associated rhomboid family serine protease
MHTASVGFHCPDCVKKGGQRVYRGPGALATQPLLTQILIAVNVAVFLLGVVVSGASAITGGSELLVDYGLIARLPGTTIGYGVGNGEWYRLITSGFLHYGIIHLAVNMYSLWILGGIVERSIGRVKFGIAYFVAILGGAVGALILTPDGLTAGASGAIFGLMGVILAFGRNRGISLSRNPIIPTLVLNLFITFGLSRYISVGGHIGGLIAGFLAGVLLFDVPAWVDGARGTHRGGPARGDVIGMALCGVLAAGLVVAGLAIAMNGTV